MVKLINKNRNYMTLPVFKLPKTKKGAQLFQAQIVPIERPHSPKIFNRTNILVFGSETIKNFILSALPASHTSPGLTEVSSFLGLTGVSSRSWNVEPPPEDLICKLWSLDLGRISSLPIVMGSISGAVIFFHSKYKGVCKPYMSRYINFIRRLPAGVTMPIALIDVRGSGYDWDKDPTVPETKNILSFMSSLVRNFFNGITFVPSFPAIKAVSSQTIEIVIESSPTHETCREVIQPKYTKPLSVWGFIKRKIVNIFSSISSFFTG